MAEGVRVPGIPGEDTPLPSSSGDDVVQGAAAGVVILRGLEHQPVQHPVMGAVVLDMARVVSLPEIGQVPSESLPAVIVVVSSGMDDDQVEIGLLVPAAGGPGAEEDDGLGVGLRRQVPAEGDGGRVGIRVDHGRQLVADAVSSHRRHGVVSSRPVRRRPRVGGLSMEGIKGGLRRGDSGGQKMRDKANYRAANIRAQEASLTVVCLPTTGLTSVPRRTEPP